MRSVTTPNFCDVCKETLWLNLLKRLSLIDGISESCTSTSKVLELGVVPLAQFRQPGLVEGEAYTIAWSRDGNPLPQFANQTRVELGNQDVIGSYAVVVEFSSVEIRKQSNHLRAHAKHEVKLGC